MMFMKKDIKQILIEAGYKITTPRLIIINYLNKEHKPISAKELVSKISKVDQASIYRTLNILEQLNLVKSEIVNKEKIYCLNIEDHHHIICIKCGYIKKIACQHHFDTVKDFSQITHQLTLNGICQKCQNKK
jgi:Fe2+ or Zn2+ uptake regulation protein